MKKKNKIKIIDRNKSKDATDILENEIPIQDNSSEQDNNGDVNHTTEVPENETDSTDSNSELMKENSKLKSELQIEVDRRLRVMAEFDNFRKRTQNDNQRVYERAGERVITKLLPIMDDFQRFLDQEITKVEPKGLKEGIELIYKKLLDNMASENVKPIESLGKIFDADIHEAIAQFEDESKPPGIILTEVERGYMMGARVIRHSKVVVNSYSEEEVESNNE